VQDISLAIKVDKRQVKDLKTLMGQVEKQVGNLNKVKVTLDTTRAQKNVEALSESLRQAEIISNRFFGKGARSGIGAFARDIAGIRGEISTVRTAFDEAKGGADRAKQAVQLLTAQFKMLSAEGRAFAKGGADLFQTKGFDQAALKNRLKPLEELPNSLAGTGEALKEIRFLLNFATENSKEFKTLIEAENNALARQKKIRESMAFVTEVQRRATAPMPADPFGAKVPLLPAAGQSSGTFEIVERNREVARIRQKSLKVERLITQENSKQAKIARKTAKERLENIRKIRRQRQGKQLNETLLGAGFPLLFGGGPGAVGGSILGGALGGKMGASFGGQIFGSAIGQQFEKAIQQATEIGNAISTLNLDALEQSGIRVNAQLRLQINALREVGDASRAEILLKEEAAKQTGALFDVTTDVANAYNILGAAGTKFGATLSTTLGILGVILAVPLAGILDGVANTLGLVNNILSVVGELSKRFVELLALIPGMKQVFDDIEKAIQGANKQLDESIVKARLITGEKAKENIVAIRSLEIESQKTAGLTAQGKINNNNLDLKSKIASLDDQERVEIKKINKELTAFNAKDIEASRNQIKATFENRRERERLVVSRRNEKILTQQSLKLEREREAERKKRLREQEQFEKKINRQIKGAETAYKSVNNVLDNYTTKLEDRAAFEREYNELINQGILPAEAKRVVELKKEALQVQRQFEAELGILDTKIKQVEASALEGNLTEDQIKRLKKLKEAQEDLEGKAADAQGQGSSAAKPKSDAKRLEEAAIQARERLNELTDPVNQVVGAAGAIGDAFSESFKGVISGSMTAQEALANLFQRTADHFLDMTAQIIAAAIKAQAVKFVTQIIGSVASAGVSSGSSFAGVENTTLDSVLPSTESLANAAAATPSFAEGGFVSRPTNALIGEGGEPEYVIPASKMRESMSRYSRGSRGGGVIPSDGGSSASGDGGVAVAAPIDVRYTVERINSVDYVTADQFQSGMQRAAAQGAQRGEQNTLKRLQMSGSTRRRLGM
jgi:hypothetical protein